MEFDEREQYINNIISGKVSCGFGNKIYLINEPTPLDKVIADRLYQDKLKEAELRGVFSNEELVHKLIALGLWNTNSQVELDAMPKRTENMKVQLYQAYFNYKGRDNIRKGLSKLKNRHIELETKRNCLKRESSDGVATTAKNKYLICANVTDINDNKLWNAEDYWKQDYKLIDTLVQKYMENMIDDEVMRELSRTEPWRTFWAVGKTESSLFGYPSIMFTTQQKNLIVWSRIYDSIYEGMECPPDEVIKDDDMLDGWLILQNKKRDEERKKSHSFGNDGSDVKGQEVFLFADSEEDAGRISSMNDASGRAIIGQRMSSLKRAGGKLDEAKMPDAQLSMRQQALQQMKSHLQR